MRPLRQPRAALLHESALTKLAKPETTAAGYKSISTRVLVSVNGVLAEARAPGMTF